MSPIILAQASFYFPQVRSFMGNNIFNQGKKVLYALQKVAHLLTDFMCDKPEECKQGIHTRFEFLSDTPQDVRDLVANMTGSSTVQTSRIDEETKRKQQGAIMHAAIYEKDDVSAKGNATKAEDVIKSLRFSSYEENYLCDLKEGIPGIEFDVTVEEIAELTNMPVRLKRVVKRARNFTGGNVLAVNRLHFKTEDGDMVFGRIAVLRKGNTLDMAYSLHSVNYELKNKQSKPENAGNFKKFFETLNANEVDDEGDGDDSDDDKDDSNEISFDLRQEFLAFFHKQAIEGFVKHCDYLLKTLDNGQKEESEILKHMAVKGDSVK